LVNVLDTRSISRSTDREVMIEIETLMADDPARAASTLTSTAVPHRPHAAHLSEAEEDAFIKSLVRSPSPSGNTHHSSGTVPADISTTSSSRPGTQQIPGLADTTASSGQTGSQSQGSSQPERNSGTLPETFEHEVVPPILPPAPAVTEAIAQTTPMKGSSGDTSTDSTTTTFSPRFEFGKVVNVSPSVTPRSKEKEETRQRGPSPSLSKLVQAAVGYGFGSEATPKSNEKQSNNKRKLDESAEDQNRQGASKKLHESTATSMETKR
jgi:hypothetical protein